MLMSGGHTLSWTLAELAIFFQVVNEHTNTEKCLNNEQEDNGQSTTHEMRGACY